MASLRNRCPRGLDLSISIPCADTHDSDEYEGYESPGTPEAMASPWLSQDEAMKALHTPTTPRYGRRRRRQSPIVRGAKAVGALALVAVLAFGAAAATGAVDGPKVLAVAKTSIKKTAGRVSCAFLGTQVVAGAHSCAGEAVPEPPAQKPPAPRPLAAKKGPLPPPPSHVKMLFRNTASQGTLTVHSISEGGEAAYHSKLGPHDERTYYIAVDQDLEFRNGGVGEGVAGDWRARVRPFATVTDDDEDDGDGAPAFGLVFENPLDEHIALEIAREGIWVEPKRHVAYTAEEGHAFHVKDRAQGDRFGCAVYALSEEELARLAKRRADREAQAARVQADKVETARKEAARAANAKLSAEAAARAAAEADERRASARAANAKAAKAKEAAKPKPAPPKPPPAKAPHKPAKAAPKPPAPKKDPPKPPAPAKKPAPAKAAPAKPAPAAAKKPAPAKAAPAKPAAPAAKKPAPAKAPPPPEPKAAPPAKKAPAK